MNVFRTSVALVAVVLFTGACEAHTVGISRGDYRPGAHGLDAELVFARPELAAAVPGLDADGDRELTAAELRAAGAALSRFVAEGIEVRAGDARCNPAVSDARLTEQDGIALIVRATCGDASTRYEVALPMLARVSLGHRHLASWRLDGQEPGNAVAYESNATFAVPASAANGGAADGVAWPLFVLGVEHILTGYDHLLFLLALIVVGGTLRQLLVVVTAFTVAHSVTLALAALGVVAPSPALVEPAIALSIAYVGVENWFVKDASRRWLLTFPFGLIHGFGFAGALEEVALPSADVPVALLSFNLGVEAGQVAVLAIVLPVLLRLRKYDWFVPAGVRVLSSGVACAGLFWFVDRVS